MKTLLWATGNAFLASGSTFWASKGALLASENAFWAGDLAVRVEWRNFRFRGWECDFRIPETISDRLVQVSSLYASSGAILGQNTFSVRFDFIGQRVVGH